MPDCNKCIWSTRSGGCVSWECDFISHEDARRIDWLSELAERRKAPEIIRCKDCKHYEWMSNRIPEEQTWHCHCWDADTGKDDFCSYAERKTE